MTISEVSCDRSCDTITAHVGEGNRVTSGHLINSKNTI